MYLPFSVIYDGDIFQQFKLNKTKIVVTKPERLYIQWWNKSQFIFAENNNFQVGEKKQQTSQFQIFFKNGTKLIENNFVTMVIYCYEGQYEVSSLNCFENEAKNVTSCLHARIFVQNFEKTKNESTVYEN